MLCLMILYLHNKERVLLMELAKIPKMLASLYSYKQYFAKLNDDDLYLLEDFVSDRHLIYDLNINNYRYTDTFDEQSIIIDVSDEHWIDYFKSYQSSARKLETQIRVSIEKLNLTEICNKKRLSS